MSKEDFKEWVERTSMIARIQTAIALQAGMMNGEIPMDDAIAELMNFGRVNFSAIAGLKKDKLNELARMLKMIKLSNQTETTERQILMLNRIRTQSALIGTADNLTESSKAFSVADQLLNDTEKLTVLDKSLTEGVNKLKSINDSIGDQSQTISQFTAWLEHLEITFIKIENTSKLLVALKSKLTTYIDLKTQLQTLKHLDAFVEMIDYRKTMPRTKMLRDSVLEDFKKIKELAVIAKSASYDYGIVNDLVMARSRPRKFARKFTIGMRNDVSDLKLLSDNLNDPWVQKMFHGKKNIGRFKRGLEPFLSICPKLEVLDLTLRAISTVEMFRSVNKIVQLQKAIEKVSATEQDVSAVLTFFDACVSTAPRNLSTIHSQIRKLIEDTTLLPDVVQDAQSVLERIIDAWHSFRFSVSKLRAHINAMLLLDHSIRRGNKTMEIVENFLLPKMSKIFRKIGNFKKMIGKIAGVRNISKNISTGHQLVIKFQNDVNVKQEFNFHACLQKANGRVEQVVETFEATAKFRKAVDDDLEKFELATIVVLQLSEHIDGLKLLHAEMKEKVGTDSERLNEMKNSMKNARKIGNSTVALQDMYEFAQLEPSINALKSGGAFVLKKIAEVPDGDKQKDTFMKIWKDHDAGVASMETQLKNVKAMELKVKPAEATSLEEYGGLLKHLQDVGSVSLNLQEELMVVGALVSLSKNSSDTEKLIELEKKMQRFEDLDLDFASHHYTVNSISGAFLALLNSVNVDNSATEPPFFTTGIGIICAVIFILLLVGGFTACYFIYPHYKESVTLMESELSK